MASTKPPHEPLVGQYVKARGAISGQPYTGWVESTDNDRVLKLRTSRGSVVFVSRDSVEPTYDWKLPECL